MKRIRLDLFLTAQYPQYSRSRIQQLIEEGYVSVDGVQKKASHLLHGGEKIEMRRRAPVLPKAEPEAIPLTILYEDDDLLIINKAVGMVVHPAPGHFGGTLVNAVLHHLGREAIEEKEVRPGIVHRLDKGTSGVMVVAKNDLAQRKLSNEWKARRVEKIYLALVFGTFKVKEGKISLAIGRDTQHRRKFSSKTRKAREAITYFKVQKTYSAGVTLLELRLETGRTHQIRVHLSESGHPILGDTVYGAKTRLSSIKEAKLRETIEAIDRPLLHALKLGFRHPGTGKEVHFEAPLPDDFQSMVEFLAKGPENSISSLKKGGVVVSW